MIESKGLCELVSYDEAPVKVRDIYNGTPEAFPFPGVFGWFIGPKQNNTSKDYPGRGGYDRLSDASGTVNHHHPFRP